MLCRLIPQPARNLRNFVEAEKLVFLLLKFRNENLDKLNGSVSILDRILIGRAVVHEGYSSASAAFN